MAVIGLDGCKNGWVAVCISGNSTHIRFFLKESRSSPDPISQLLTLNFDRAAIDMPIGLPDFGRRRCDERAGERLREHGSRVFLGAQRALFAHNSQASANRELWERGEKGVSCQLWGLREKLREVDKFVLRYRDTIDLREAHPELVFRRLSHNEPLDSKKSPKGIKKRVEILRREGFGDIDLWLDKTRLGTGAKKDDVLDACAAAIAARDFDKGYVVPIGEPQHDSKGLPMQIWY